MTRYNNLKMKKVLPVNKPPITTYMTHAPILSIISNNNEYLPWFFLNYIQMRVHDDGIDFYHFYTAHYSCPYFDTTYLSREFTSHYIKNETITDFLAQCIDDNYYVVVLIDTSFVSLYESAHQGDTHPIFIYGYDTESNTFFVADFFNRGKFDFGEVFFDELELAYKKCDDNLHWQKGIHLLKRIDYNKRYTNIDIANSLEKYLKGYEISKGYNQNTDDNAVFGLDVVYDRVMKEMRNFKSLQPYDSRVLPIFCEHKIVLKMLGVFLSNHGCDGLNEDYNLLYEKAFILRNKWIKYNRQQANNLYDENELRSLKNLEIKLLKRTIDILSHIDQPIYY